MLSLKKKNRQPVLLMSVPARAHGIAGGPEGRWLLLRFGLLVSVGKLGEGAGGAIMGTSSAPPSPFRLSASSHIMHRHHLTPKHALYELPSTRRTESRVL